MLEIPLAAKLDMKIKKVCPIHGVSIGDPNDKSTWKISFMYDNTEAEMQAANEVLQNFNPNEPSSIEINNERARREMLGSSFEVTGYGSIYVSGDQGTQFALLALKDTARDLQEAQIEDPIIPFRDFNNDTHFLTAAQMIELVNKGKTYVQNLYTSSWNLKNMDPIPEDYTDNKYWE